jgi:hypothetical protein
MHEMAAQYRGLADHRRQAEARLSHSTAAAPTGLVPTNLPGSPAAQTRQRSDMPLPGRAAARSTTSVEAAPPADVRKLRLAFPQEIVKASTSSPSIHEGPNGRPPRRRPPQPDMPKPQPHPHPGVSPASADWRTNTARNVKGAHALAISPRGAQRPFAADMAAPARDTQAAASPTPWCQSRRPTRTRQLRT